MLCPACDRVLPAEGSVYTAERASLIVLHGVCICADSHSSTQVKSAQNKDASLEADTGTSDEPFAPAPDNEQAQTGDSDQYEPENHDTPPPRSAIAG